jgi:4-hydroxy-tetrahydrodipicolinate synthase
MPRPFDLARLATVHLVPPTPFSPDGRRVLPEVLGRFVREMVAAGVRVFIPAAGTGEFHSLSAAEAVDCLRVTREAAGAGCTVLAPVGLALTHAVEVGRGALEAGADALLVMPPVHPYLCDAGFGDYLRAIADAVPLPVLTYKRGSVPGDKLLLQLADEGRLVGVKYAVNDVDAFAKLASAAAGRLGLYCGTAERFAPFFMLAGAAGYTSGSGCVAPRLTLALHAALAAGDSREAMRLLQVIRPLEDARARDGDSYNISLVKFWLEECGHPFGPPRPPQRRLTDGEKAEFAKVLAPVRSAEATLTRS